MSIFLAQDSSSAFEDFFDSQAWGVTRNLGIFLLVVLWLAMAYWVLKDARRRIDDPWLVATATVLGLVPLVGPIVYLFFRPPEYMEDVRERQLEIRAMEERLADEDLKCPVCRARVERSYLVCPVCTTKLKQACDGCGAPLEQIWQLCPYCATPVPPTDLPADSTLQPLRPRRKRAAE